MLHSPRQRCAMDPDLGAPHLPSTPFSHPFLPHGPHLVLSHIPPWTLLHSLEEDGEARNGNLTVPQFTGDLGQSLLLPRVSVSLSARV